MGSLNLDTLNPQQREAVLHRNGPMLLLAGAGSGKTRVATFRIAHLIRTGVRPENILAVTFTNKAATEMAERVGQLVSRDDAAALTVCTFHKLGVSVLREQADRAGVVKDFTILDAPDQLATVVDAMRTCRLDPERYEPSWVLQQISAAKNSGLSPDKLGTRVHDVVGQVVREAWQAYDLALRELKAVDFDDLILRPLLLFQSDPKVLSMYQQRYRYLLVDEFQDTNGVQFEWVKLLAGSAANVFAVGDDDQSIYGWRGARSENVSEFERVFPGARVLALERNYRSTEMILAAANAVIVNNRGRRPKAMWTADSQGAPIRVVRLDDADTEAEFVAREIGRRLRQAEPDRAPRDFGILIRTNMQARLLEEALRQEGVPYHLVGAFSFYDRKEVRDVLAHLRTIVNPADELSVRRALAFPPSGLGPSSLARLKSIAAASRRPLGHVFADAQVLAGLPTRAQKACGELHRAHDKARERLAARRPLAGTLRQLWSELGLQSALAAEAKSKAEVAARWRNVEYLMRQVEVYESRRGGEASLVDFLRSLSLDQKEDRKGEADEVQVMTLHAAKGLEFPVVYLCGVEDGILPHQRSIDSGDIDEERRLFYVGLTRAREELTVTHSRRRSRQEQRAPVTPSRFLAELPDAVCVKEDHTGAGDAPDTALREAAFAKIAKLLGKTEDPT